MANTGGGDHVLDSEMMKKKMNALVKEGDFRFLVGPTEDSSEVKLPIL